MSLKYAINIIIEHFNETLKLELIVEWKMHVSLGNYKYLILKYTFSRTDLVA